MLTAALTQTQALATCRPPPWSPYYGEWRLQKRHGPKYAAGRWFGAQPEKIRARLRRAIDRLEERGLVETWREQFKLSHLRLTAAGELAARELAKEQRASRKAARETKADA